MLHGVEKSQTRFSDRTTKAYTKRDLKPADAQGLFRRADLTILGYAPGGGRVSFERSERFPAARTSAAFPRTVLLASLPLVFSRLNISVLQAGRKIKPFLWLLMLRLKSPSLQSVAI